MLENKRVSLGRVSDLFMEFYVDRLIKRELGRRTIDELLESLEWRSGWQERTSGLARSHLET